MSAAPFRPVGLISPRLILDPRANRVDDIVAGVRMAASAILRDCDLIESGVSGERVTAAVCRLGGAIALAADTLESDVIMRPAKDAGT